MIIKLKGHQYRWLSPGNRTFLEVASMVVTWWIVTFLWSASSIVVGHATGALITFSIFPRLSYNKV